MSQTKGLSLEEIDLLFAKKDYKPVLEARLRSGRGQISLSKEDTTATAELVEYGVSKV